MKNTKGHVPDKTKQNIPSFTEIRKRFNVVFELDPQADAQALLSVQWCMSEKGESRKGVR